MTLKELNNKYFELYGDLYQARALLTDKQYKLTAEALLMSYKDDLDVCFAEKALAVGRERFELKYKVRNWLPHRVFVFWHNKIGKKLLKKYLADFEAELLRLDEATTVVSAPPTAAEEPNTNLPVPQSRDVETL